jgi:hypothetical protein
VGEKEGGGEEEVTAPEVISLPLRRSVTNQEQP